jgi:hypothetical protein
LVRSHDEGEEHAWRASVRRHSPVPPFTLACTLQAAARLFLHLTRDMPDMADDIYERLKVCKRGGTLAFNSTTRLVPPLSPVTLANPPRCCFHLHNRSSAGAPDNIHVIG